MGKVAGERVMRTAKGILATAEVQGQVNSINELAKSAG